MVAVFTATIFVSAGLLFLVEPMVAKMILPRFGGAPAVWTTSVLFFQALLLAGYLYAHVAIRRLGLQRHAAVHVAVLLAPLAFLPIAVGAPSGTLGANPVLPLLGVLAAAVGLPFFVVAASGPMLQRWFAATGHPSGRDPYFLYAASNLGSMLGLIAYPALIEPHMTLGMQSRAWTVGYVALSALSALCALMVWRVRGKGASASIEIHEVAATEPVSWSRRVRWIGLAFVPSSLMLGVTARFSNDIVPVPLLWIVPLALYLLTFVFTFARKPLLRHATMRWALPFVLLLVAFAMGIKLDQPVWVPLLVHLAGFFIAAMVCHGALAHDRPAPARLTEFFLLISVGGVLGGVFNAVLAPVLFNTIAEYPLALVLAALSGGALASRITRRELIPLALIIAMIPVGARSVSVHDNLNTAVLFFTLLAVLTMSMKARPTFFAGGLAGVLLVGSFVPPSLGSVMFRERTFFGVHTVKVDSRGRHLFLNGNTVHGVQAPPGSQELLSYYHAGSPISDVFEAKGDRARSVGVIGLGTGTLAAYARSDQRWTFFEIDPVVEKIARDPRYFTFLRDSAAPVRVVIGDARLSLDRTPTGAPYDLLVIDAFTSDTIPVHLLTRDALQVYLRRLSPNGVIVFHISNRYLNLAPVTAALARDAGLASSIRIGSITSTEAAQQKFASIWVAMAHDEKTLGPLAHSGGWTPLRAAADAPVWTDDFSNILSVFK